MGTATVTVVAPVEQVQAVHRRLLSLDLFRGATIAAMIVVNNQNSDDAYWPLQHAAWNGWTPTDLVFPFFLFIVGVALVFSFHSRLERGESRRDLILHSTRRGVTLFAIGLVLNGLAALQFQIWRIPGVLQRIAIVYLAAALVMLFTEIPGRVAWIASLLVGYWILMRYVPVPGYGMPVRDVPLLHPDGNLAAYFDRKLLLGHLWEGTRDPEGILSTLPATATALCGVLTGEWLRSARPTKLKLVGMFGYGLAGILVGQLWAIWFPINKKLWTSSYVLFTAGCALIALALCYWISDIRLYRSGWTRPFIFFGTNAIVAYVLSELFGGWLTWIGFTVWPGPVWLKSLAMASLVHSMFVLALCLVAVWWLYRKRIFIKI